MKNRFFNQQDDQRPNPPFNILQMIANKLNTKDQLNFSLVNHEAHRVISKVRNRKITKGETYFAVPNQHVKTSATKGFSGFCEYPITAAERDILSVAKTASKFLLFETLKDAQQYSMGKSNKFYDKIVRDATWEYPIFEINCTEAIDKVSLCRILHLDKDLPLEFPVLRLDSKTVNGSFEQSAYYFNYDKHEINNNNNNKCNIF